MEKLMPDYIFLDKNQKPNDENVKNALGKTYDIWDGIKKSLSLEYGELTEEWKYYSKNSGWTMKLLLKKRNLLFFTPYNNSFAVSLIFGDKAVTEVNNSRIPQNIKDDLNNAVKYAEGRGIRIEVKIKKDALYVIELIKIKIKN